MAEPTTLEVAKSRRLSAIWLVPIIALFVGVWLGVKALNEKGASVEIVFNNASGIAVEKTKIRYKDVDVGKVTRLRLSEDLERVFVTAEMSRDISPHLSENTRFWVVRPKISVAGVSGLSTLFSGVYIAMDPGDAGVSTKQFTGLETPPPIRSDSPGSVFVLRALKLGSVAEGTPVFFREIKVGEVTSYNIDEQDGWIEIKVFIPKPYDQWVSKRSRFWNISGFNVDVGADGVALQSGPLSSLILGGIAFDAGPVDDVPAEEGSFFFLYSNYDAVVEGSFRLKYPYLLHFNESVRGLKVGSGVEYKGIKVGEVTQIELHSENKNTEFGVNVFIEIEPQRFDSVRLAKREVMNEEIRGMIERGVRAQLKTSSLVLGSLFVELIENSKQEGLALTNTSIPSIPTVPSQLQDVTRKFNDLVDRVNQLPVSEIGIELKESLTAMHNILGVIDRNNTAQDIDDLVTTLNTASVDLTKALEKLTSTLDATDEFLQASESVVSPNSQLHYELIRMLEEVRKAARSVETLSTSLQEKPESLIFGRGKQ